MRTILIDADFLIYNICSALEPYYYYVGEKYYRTKKDAIATLTEEQSIEDVIKHDFRVPPTSIKPICISVVKNFMRKINNNLVDTEWEGAKEIFFFNSKTNFRKDFCDVYKSSRRDKPFYHDRVKDWLIKETDAVVVEGFESDDTVAVFAEVQRGKGLLVHCDKDLNNIPCTHYDFLKEELYYVSKEEALESLLTQIITGDSVDDIIGFPRAGPAKARKILAEVPIYNNIPKEEWLFKCWSIFLEEANEKLIDKFTPEVITQTIHHTLPLVDVGGYWTRRLGTLWVDPVVDYRPMLQKYRDLGL